MAQAINDRCNRDGHIGGVIEDYAGNYSITVAVDENEC
jgi:hypothetical protein